MKLIEAMKEQKALLTKAEDLRKKIANYCAKASFETSTYADQTAQIKEWQQSHHDTIKRVGQLQVAIQRTNLNTMVTLTFPIQGSTAVTAVTHSISEWIIRRRQLAVLEQSVWAALTDKNIREGQSKQTDGSIVEVKIVRFYDPAERDRNVELYRTEPGLIDRTLETVNAITDLIEA